MQNVTKKLFPRVHFLKKFILYDGLNSYLKLKSQANNIIKPTSDSDPNNSTSTVNCDPEWPICLYDFTIK